MIRKILLAFAGLLAAVLLLEGLVRLAPGFMPPGFRLLNRAFDAEVNWSGQMISDPYLGYRLRPEQEYEEELEGHLIRARLLRLESQDVGVRDMGLPIGRHEGVAIGDSFTFCSTVSSGQCWLRLVSDLTGYPFVNLGVPGYSALQETRMLERYGLLLHPDLILWGIFLNDLKENVRFDSWVHSGGEPYLAWVRNQRVGLWADFLERNSVVYRVLRRIVIAQGRGIHHWRGRDGDLHLSGAGWWRGIVDMSDDSLRWRLMREAVLKQKQLAAEAGARLAVLLFPSKEQAYWHVVKDFAADAQHCDPDKPYRMIAALCEAEGIPVLDLTEAFRERARQGEVLYLRDDAHWNEAGNAVAGRAVAAWLRDQGLTGKGN